MCRNNTFHQIQVVGCNGKDEVRPTLEGRIILVDNNNSQLQRIEFATSEGEMERNCHGGKQHQSEFVRIIFVELIFGWTRPRYYPRDSGSKAVLADRGRVLKF